MVKALVCTFSPANTLATPVSLRLTADAIMQDLAPVAPNRLLTHWLVVGCCRPSTHSFSTYLFFIGLVCRLISSLVYCFRRCALSPAWGRQLNPFQFYWRDKGLSPSTLDLSVMQTIVSKIILFFVRGMRGIFVSRRELSNKVTWGCWGLKMEERVS